MNLWFVAPATLCCAASAIGPLARKRLPPAVATYVLTVALGLTALSVMLAVAAVAVRFAHHVFVTMPASGFAGAVASAQAHGVAPAVGIVSWAVLVAIGGSVALSIRRDRRAIAGATSSARRLRASTVPVAFAVPGRCGRPGRVVVSLGMLRLLEPAERPVVIAHERAHLRLGHHRFLRVGHIAVAVVPVLAGTGAALRLSTERWADEAAAAEIGDRQLVARAIARAALAGDRYRHAPSFTGGAVADRVHAMLQPPAARPLGSSGLAVLITGAVAASAAVQGHHLLDTVRGLC